MPKVLIVDDEPGINELLESIFKDLNYETLSCLNGKEAQNVIPLYKPDMIISDIKMTPVNGIELLHWVKKEKVDVPFVFITGFNDVLLLKEALDLGAFSLIKKPFDESEIINTADRAIGKQSHQKEFVDDDFCKIDLKKFITGSISCCSIFVKIRTNHYVKIAEKNDSLSINKIKEYEKRDLNFLYVLKDDFSELVGFNLKLMKAVSVKNNISGQKVLNFINFSNSIILENAFFRQFDNRTLLDIEYYSKMVLNILKRSDSLMKMLMNLNESSNNLYAHSLSTAVVSYLIAKRVGWNSEPTLCKVFLSGLLHDVGLKKLDSKIIEKNHKLFTDYERDEYRKHPILGMELLNELDGVPEEVILAAYQHQEFCDGSGYPLGLKKNKISPISKLVSVADILDCHSYNNKDHSLISLRKTITYIERVEAKKYDPVFFEALKEIFDI
ncbi:MAG: hypothetical protein CME60_12055 [Halobacteriovoraceae bacterium]|nr:hypothetical protein [Halobacteriovoraceae bacterium]